MSFTVFMLHGVGILALFFFLLALPPARPPVVAPPATTAQHAQETGRAVVSADAA